MKKFLAPPLLSADFGILQYQPDFNLFNKVIRWILQNFHIRPVIGINYQILKNTFCNYNVFL
ncbi:MAG: hypothetical protein LBB53_04865 [Prevotellaceae bacterium]|jgi:hypothetical protein|nr:hypothetical protein [Prevotellaceae bacterium]